MGALLFSAFCSLLSWRGLANPVLPEHDVIVELGLLYVIGLMSLLLAAAECLRERIWLGLTITVFSIGFTERLFPRWAEQVVVRLNELDLLLWVLATLLSLSLLKSALRGAEHLP
jgi:hypothetical protein